MYIHGHKEQIKYMQQVNWIIAQIKSVHNLHIHPIV